MKAAIRNWVVVATASTADELSELEDCLVVDCDESVLVGWITSDGLTWHAPPVTDFQALLAVLIDKGTVTQAEIDAKKAE